jgi:hypothetical protein
MEIDEMKRRLQKLEPGSPEAEALNAEIRTRLLGPVPSTETQASPESVRKMVERGW